MSTLSDQIHAVLALDPAAPAIEFEKSWTSWGELAAIMAEIGALLDAAGLPAGTRVGVMMRNHVLTAATLLEVVASDRCIVTLNAQLPDERLASDISAQKVPVVIGLARDWARGTVRAAVAASGGLGIVLGESGGRNAAFVAGLEKATGSDLDRTAPGIAIEMLSSGTTGTPKRVPLKATSFAQGIELIDDIPPAAELIVRLRREYVAACQVPDMADVARIDVERLVEQANHFKPD